MSVWRQVARGVQVLGNRTSADREIADEVNHYLEEAAAAHMERGLSPDAARRAATLELGNATAVREQVRTYGWENMIDTLLTDLRYTVRRLTANPGFTAVSILTLALGIGASTAIFSVIESVLLKPLPYPGADRLIALVHTAPGVNIKELGMAPSFYITYGEEGRVFQNVALWRGDNWTVTGRGTPEQVQGLSVSHNFLATLGVQPAVGRGFTVADESFDSQRVVMLTDSYWKARFGGDRSIAGKAMVTLDGDNYTVIGVLPADFVFMDRKFSLVAPRRYRRANVGTFGFCCQGIARLRPGVTLAQADQDATRVLPMVPQKFPLKGDFGKNAFVEARISPTFRSMKDDLTGDIGKTLWVLMATVGIVLSIACANVANLLLVRADGRRQELAVRAALGAGWRRIARDLLMESILLGVAGGVLGLGLAYGALRLLVTSDLTRLPRIEDISIDPLVMAFALVISLGSGLLFGLIPVFRYARPALSTGLRGGGRSLTGSVERSRTRNVLVVVQVALALVLLVGSGLMIRTFRALRNVDPGFSHADELETARIGIPGTQVKDSDGVLRMQREIENKFRALPGVSAVAMITSIPLVRGEDDPIFAEDRKYAESTIPPVRRFKYVSPGYFATVGSRLIAGRDMTWDETYNKAPVALISENLARELWHDARTAIGKRIRPSRNDDWREIIGVVADLHDDGVDRKAASVVYWPLLLKNFSGNAVFDNRSVAFIVRTSRAGSAAFRQELQNAVGSVNPMLPLADVRTLGSVYDKSLARASFTLVLLAIAGGMALVLGVVGIYGVISYSVSQRAKEIGIRMALGSPLRGVTGLFVRHGLAMSGVGTVCGLAAALALTGVMKSLLFEVSPVDLVTYVAAASGLILAAFAGSYLPARRATRVNAVEALRTE